MRELVVDYGGTAVNVNLVGAKFDRRPEVFVAIAEQVRKDLGL
jgi:hypothetical protein